MENNLTKEIFNREKKKKKSICILGHISPDGDCVGSVLGTYNYIRSLKGLISGNAAAEEDRGEETESPVLVQPYLEEVSDDIALEDGRIISLEAVKDLTSYRHDSLKFRISSELDRTQSRITLNNVEFSLADVPGSAVNELLDPVVDIKRTHELLLDIDPGLIGILSRALVDQYLIDYLIAEILILREPDLKIILDELGHEVLNELVVDSLLRLVLVRSLSRECIGNKDQGIGDILEDDLGFICLVLVAELDLAVYLGYKGRSDGLIRRTAVLKEARIMEILEFIDVVIEAERHLCLDLILVSVRLITALALSREEERIRKASHV